MKVNKIEQSSISADDVLIYKERVSKLEGIYFNGSDVNINKRIISIRLGNKEDELTLVNPKIISKADNQVVYFEKDTNKENKIRKTISVPWLVIETDNLGKVEFKAEKTEWKDAEEFFGDV